MSAIPIPDTISAFQRALPSWRFEAARARDGCRVNQIALASLSGRTSRRADIPGSVVGCRVGQGQNKRVRASQQLT